MEEEDNDDEKDTEICSALNKSSVVGNDGKTIFRPSSLPAIKIKGAGLRTGALAGAVGSYFAVSSNRLESHDSGVQFHTGKRTVTSNVEIMDLEGNRMSGLRFVDFWSHTRAYHTYDI